MPNIYEILQHCPKGRALYSPAFGRVTFYCVKQQEVSGGWYRQTINRVVCQSMDGKDLILFNDYGIFLRTDCDVVSDGRVCCLFPSVTTSKGWDFWASNLCRLGDAVKFRDGSFGYLAETCDKVIERFASIAEVEAYRKKQKTPEPERKVLDLHLYGVAVVRVNDMTGEVSTVPVSDFGSLKNAISRMVKFKKKHNGDGGRYDGFDNERDTLDLDKVWPSNSPLFLLSVYGKRNTANGTEWLTILRLDV